MKKRKLALFIMMIAVILIATGCADSGQDKKQDQQSTQNESYQLDQQLTKLETAAGEKTTTGAVTTAAAEKTGTSLTSTEADAEENQKIIDETLQTLNELEETINSLDEASDSDLQMPE